MSPRAALLLVLLAATTAAAVEPRKVGIYPLERIGPADPAYDRLQESLRRNIGFFPDVEAFDLATPSRCRADDVRCLVGVGQLAAADVVVHGSVERFGEGYAVRLQLIDVTTTTRREVKRLVHGGAEELAAAMEGAACELVVTGRCEGSLRITGPAGARVVLAGRDVAELPWNGTLPVGRHAVRVTRAGLSTEERYVGVSYGQEAMLSVTENAGLLAFSNPSDFGEAPVLPPEIAVEPTVNAAPASVPAPPIPLVTTEPASGGWMEPAMYASFGVGGALLATGAVFGVMSEVAASEANDRFERRVLVESDRTIYEASRSRARTANALFVGGAGCVALGALLYVLMPNDAGSPGDVQFGAGPTGLVAAGSF